MTAPRIGLFQRKVSDPNSPPKEQPQTFVDSLNTITGKPLFDVRWPKALSGADGEGSYRPLLDAIAIRSDLTGDAYDHARAHEAGHRVDPTASYASGDQGATRSAYDAYVASHPDVHAQGYAATGPREQFAEAFADGIDILRRYARTAPGDPHTYAVAMREAGQASTPGTQAIVEHLLTTPLYANHPLRRQSSPAATPAASSNRF